MANIAKIKYNCISNGEGLRTAVFFSGCNHRCQGCFNKELWDFNYGAEYSKKIEIEILNSLNSTHISGLSILGGEPLCEENYFTVLKLCQMVKQFYPNKTIYVWTGYTKEQLQEYKRTEIFDLIDILVDGKFIEEEKDLSLDMRGSRNQRILKKGIDFS